MSGGFFDYQQHRMTDIIESIESVIENNGRAKTKEELKDESWHQPDWYEKYPEDLYYPKYSSEAIEKFKEGVLLLKKAQIYAQRIDWFLSGDDGEKSFFSRLKEDLGKLGDEPNGETQTWEEIREEYSKDEYPPFGGPFTNAKSFGEWLELYYEVPKIKP
jgi:hypothetical protein